MRPSLFSQPILVQYVDMCDTDSISMYLKKNLNAPRPSVVQEQYVLGRNLKSQVGYPGMVDRYPRSIFSATAHTQHQKV